MRLLDDFYVYPWTSYQENNCNTIFVDGAVPLIIDPGHMHLFNHVVEAMARDGKSTGGVKCVFCTHGHPDHMEAVEMFGSDVVSGIGKTEYEYLENGGKDILMAIGCRMTDMTFKVMLKPGLVTLGDKTFRVIDTPGHSPGSICLYWEEKRALISGDTVFYMGVGRTDIPGGDAEKLARLWAAHPELH